MAAVLMGRSACSATIFADSCWSCSGVAAQDLLRGGARRDARSHGGVAAVVTRWSLCSKASMPTTTGPAVWAGPDRCGAPQRCRARVPVRRASGRRRVGLPRAGPLPRRNLRSRSPRSARSRATLTATINQLLTRSPQGRPAGMSHPHEAGPFVVRLLILPFRALGHMSSSHHPLVPCPDSSHLEPASFRDPRIHHAAAIDHDRSGDPPDRRQGSTSSSRCAAPTPADVARPLLGQPSDTDSKPEGRRIHEPHRPARPALPDNTVARPGGCPRLNPSNRCSSRACGFPAATGRSEGSSTSGPVWCRCQAVGPSWRSC
jgi:hypothetical protein